MIWGKHIINKQHILDIIQYSNGLAIVQHGLYTSWIMAQSSIRVTNEWWIAILNCQLCVLLAQKVAPHGLEMVIQTFGENRDIVTTIPSLPQ